MSEKFIKLLERLLKEGFTLEIDTWEGEVRTILHTGSKIWCHVYDTKDGLLAKMRYNQTKKIEEWSDILDAIGDCRGSSNELDHDWCRILGNSTYEYEPF